MSLIFKQLEKKDYKKAINYAIEGMHFHIYFDSDFMTYSYGKYFLYNEMIHATQIIAGYEDDELAGLLISRVNDEKRVHHSFKMSLYVGLVDFISSLFFKDSAGEYDRACIEMLNDYKKEYSPDGEIIFLASMTQGKGIGTLLLNEYERRERGKMIYLYTDDQCTYQFYEHRGFTRVQEKDIVLNLNHKIDLKCMLYSKEIK